MSIALIFCLALGTIGTYGSVLVPGYELGALYSGYAGEYAKKYDNYQKSYAFEYGVSDPHTGDHKNQWETKDKEGTVRGSYSLLEPDGTTRIVDYIADEHGFRAVVKKVGVHGTSIETHGGAEEHASPVVAVAAPVAHIEPQPTIIEEPVSYKSYDGGYEDYSGLKAVVADVYTKPLEYIQAPKAELVIKVPEYPQEYPSSYSHDTPLYPEAEGLKVSLPQEYWSPEYIPQEKYILPEQKYTVPQEKYVLPQEYHAPAPEYVFSAPQQIQKYAVPEYKIPQQYNAPVPAPVPEIKAYEAPIAYQISHAPSAKGAYSYVQEQRYNTPKGQAVIAEAPKFAYIEAPKEAYWPAPAPAVLSNSHSQYNLNVDYHY